MKATLTVILLLFISHAQYAQRVDSLETALKTAQGDLKVKTLNELFREYINSDPVRALGYTREALSLATEISDQKGMAASYNNLGVAYKNQGALDKGLEYYLTALKIYNELDNREGVATTKNNIANIYSMKKDYSQAMKYFEESEGLLAQMNDQARMIGTMNNLGNLHSDLQLFDKALKFYTDAWQLSEKLGKPFGDPLSNIGNLYFRQGNYQRAVEFYEKALSLAEKENNKLNILNINANMGEVYVKAKRPAEAEKYLNRAYELTKEMNASYFEPQILRSQASNFAVQKKMDLAYAKMLEYDAAKEKVHGEESSRRIAQMEMALELQEVEKKFEQERKDAEITKLELRNTRMVISTVILGLVVLIASFNLFFSRRRGMIR